MIETDLIDISTRPHPLNSGKLSGHSILLMPNVLLGFHGFFSSPRHNYTTYKLTAFSLAFLPAPHALPIIHHPVYFGGDLD